MRRFASIAILVFASVCAVIGASQQPPHKRGAKPAQTAAASAAADPRAAIVRENNFGVALMNRQQFESALGKFQRACILDPQTDIACLNIGIAFLNMQLFDDARKVLE